MKFEIKEIEEFILKILNEPISKRFPNGYMACVDCKRYFHHKIIYCPTCGKKIEYIKDMLWKNFINLVKNNGAGPGNTLSAIIYKHFDIDYFKDKSKWSDFFDLVRFNKFYNYIYGHNIKEIID